MKALVTGGTGFVGGQVVERLLIDGHTVRVFSRGPQVPERFQGRNVEMVRGDLEDALSLIKAMEDIDIFYHIGEIKNITKSAAEKNISIVEQIVGNLTAKKIGRFVFISSLSVAGIPSAVPATEDTKPAIALRDSYTSCKRRCEEMIRESAGGCEYAIVRPAPVYGPGSRFLGSMVRAIGLLGPIGIPFIGNAKSMAPLIYVEDLAAAICRAGTAPAAAGQIFNLTDGLSHTWLDFFTAIAEAQGKKLRIVPLPSLLLKLMGAPIDLFSGLFGINIDPVHYVDYFSKDLLFDNAKAKALLDWHPSYSLPDGVREMVVYYKNR